MAHRKSSAAPPVSPALLATLRFSTSPSASRAVIRGVPVQALFWQDEALDGERTTRTGGKEVFEVPLCAACAVEVEIDGIGEQGVVQRGLRRVDKLDGGLTRRRWEVKEGVGVKGSGHARRVRKSSPLDALFQPGGDRTESGGLSIGDATIYSPVPIDTTIWVNLFDPINGPSFKPSPLKPIPQFMQRPPTPMHEAQCQTSVVDTDLQPPSPLSRPASRASTICCTTSSTPIPASATVISPLRGCSAPPSRESSHEYVGDRGPLDLRRQQIFSFIKEEPLKRPSSRRTAYSCRSKTYSSAYQTPPEYLDSVSYPRPLFDKNPLKSPSASSEYLERYQPLVSPSVRKQDPSVEIPRRIGEEGDLRGRYLGDERRRDDGGAVKGVGAELKRFFTGK
ncbi:Fc.00g109050.m01.CDS01 [Cosmosporella sp. VM-42]